MLLWDKSDVERLQRIGENIAREDAMSRATDPVCDYSKPRTEIPDEAWRSGVRSVAEIVKRQREKLLIDRNAARIAAEQMSSMREAPKTRNNTRPVSRHIQKPGHNKTPFTFSGDNDSWIPYTENNDSGTDWPSYDSSDSSGSSSYDSGSSSSDSSSSSDYGGGSGDGGGASGDY